MDKWLNNRWVLKIISLLIAILLFLVVNMDNVGDSKVGGIPGVTDGSEVLEDVDLNIYYDKEKYVVTEAPESVQVNLRGPQNVLTLVQLSHPDYEAYIDLQDEGAGSHYEQIQHRGFPTELSVSIVPMNARVTLEEKVTASIPVEVDFINDQDLNEDGYTIGTPRIEPETVQVTGAESVVEHIDSAQVQVDLEGEDATFEISSSVTFYNSLGSEVPLESDPSVVDVEIPITAPSKAVPVEIDHEGQSPDGHTIDSIEMNPESVTIFGPNDVLEDTSSVNAGTIDLTSIDEDTTLEMPINIPDRVKEVSPEMVEVNITLEEAEEEVWESFPIEVIGLSETSELEFLDPEGGEINVTVIATSTVLEGLETEDVNISIDVEGLETGEHEVALQYRVPENVQIMTELSEAVVMINDDDDE
ncbi:CdaR family protein [Texcoconibacillus texcoconensis]|uniref:YbbR domain-containing protein n=1 Tax=Texcoconibacillus texcoconensis TaxID=1095777 RepID=A0A840QSH1_9BACI|nr:CdaR family protein [Texcoconibacillus texcoconensis]MBB5174315.1 YbbR domain-containing protein [Texcoconibacillus texcoconensis]